MRGYMEVSGGNLSKYAFYEDATRIDTYAAVRQIKAPILVVQGDQDATIPMKHVERLREALDSRKDRLEIIKDADHSFTHAEHFDKMISLIAEFLIAQLL